MLSLPGGIDPGGTQLQKQKEKKIPLHSSADLNCFYSEVMLYTTFVNMFFFTCIIIMTLQSKYFNANKGVT